MLAFPHAVGPRSRVCSKQESRMKDTLLEEEGNRINVTDGDY